MRLQMRPGVVHVALSERNLKALLAKLQGHPPDSSCTISYAVPDLGWLYVTAEPDAVHYANPERDTPEPGEMHPDTEERLR
jgi:hypothetical protein